MSEEIEAKIEKLLRVADGTANENESAVALQMAQKLADAYNLDLGVIGKSGSRKDQQISKGLYQYQRTLYSEVAALNHCKVWISKGLVKGSKYTTRLLGSKVNVAMTVRVCDYVEEVANRLVRENMSHVNFFSKDAHLYREGVIDRMVSRIKERRAEEERERLAAKREQEARMRHPGAASENAIVLISDVAAAEQAANYDYEHGEGAWDRLQARIAQREQERKDALERVRQWELANPEEAARRAAEARAEQEKWDRQWEARQRKLERAAERRRRRRRQERIDRFGYDPQDYKPSKPTKYDSNAYWQGQRDGKDVGLDDQIDEQKRGAIK